MIKQIKQIIKIINSILTPKSLAELKLKVSILHKKAYKFEEKITEEDLEFVKKMFLKSEDPIVMYKSYMKFLFEKSPRDTLRKEIFKLRYNLYALNYEDYCTLLNFITDLENKIQEKINKKIFQLTKYLLEDSINKPYEYLSEEAHLQIALALAMNGGEGDA